MMKYSPQCIYAFLTNLLITLIIYFIVFSLSDSFLTLSSTFSVLLAILKPLQSCPIHDLLQVVQVTITQLREDLYSRCKRNRMN